MVKKIEGKANSISTYCRKVKENEKNVGKYIRKQLQNGNRIKLLKSVHLGERKA